MNTLLRRMAPLVVLATTAACEDPPAPCHVASAPYFARFMLVSDSGPCGISTYDVVGLEVYPGSGPSGLDPSRPNIAVQSSRLGNLRAEAEFSNLDIGEQRAFAFGACPELADADGLCRVGDLAAAEIKMPPFEVFNEFGEIILIDGQHVRETWSNVAMRVSHEVPGVRFGAELTVEEINQGCTTTYTVSALSPSVECGRLGLDDFGNDAFIADDGLCSAIPQPYLGMSQGSGIHPSIPTRCDPETLHCMPAGSPLDPL